MHIKKIMIVDDLPQITYTVKYGLEKLDSNYDVLRVESGKKCIELLENNQIPDLILLDIMMPDMNGWKVAKKLQDKLEWRKIPIIFLTATEDETSKITGSIIAEDYIGKPFEIKELKKKIDTVLKKRT
ncbi:MAG: response regulator [Thermoplasmatales archaeon]|nr:MAG: response regulator [Thermoplasmatales archaeon]